MTTLKGKGVYGAIALGRISVFTRKEASVKRTHIDDIEAEKARLESAKEKATDSFGRYTTRRSRRSARQTRRYLRFT